MIENLREVCFDWLLNDEWNLGMRERFKLIEVDWIGNWMFGCSRMKVNMLFVFYFLNLQVGSLMTPLRLFIMHEFMIIIS